MPFLDYDGLRVEDMQGDDFSLVQSQDEIDAFNDEYNQDFVCYYIEWVEGCADKLYGCDGFFLVDCVYLVARL